MWWTWKNWLSHTRYIKALSVSHKLRSAFVFFSKGELGGGGRLNWRTLMTHSESCCIKMITLIFQATIWQAIISGNWRINFMTAWSEFKWMCFYLAPSKINQQWKQTNGIICSSFYLRFVRVCNPIIQTKLEQTHCCSYVYLKVKCNAFWQRLSPGGGGYSHTLPIRVCDFEAPDLERGIHFRGVF